MYILTCTHTHTLTHTHTHTLPVNNAWPLTKTFISFLKRVI